MADVEVTNLSRHGLFVKGGSVSGNHGMPVHLEVTLPSGEVVIVEGELVRTVGGDLPGAGIRFTTTTPKVRRELANYMIKRHFVARS